MLADQRHRIIRLDLEKDVRIVDALGRTALLSVGLARKWNVSADNEGTRSCSRAFHELSARKVEHWQGRKIDSHNNLLSQCLGGFVNRAADAHIGAAAADVSFHACVNIIICRVLVSAEKDNRRHDLP